MSIIVPLFGWLSSVISKEKLIPALFLFFVSNLLIFSLLLKSYPKDIAPFFFSWVSVFNLTTISLFWTVIGDSCSLNKGKVLFGPIAAGGSIGAFLGPVLTSQLVRILHPQGMVILSATLLLLSVILLRKIKTLEVNSNEKLQKKVGGGILAGLQLLPKSPFLMGIATLVFVGNVLGTFLYFRQAELLSYIDLGANTLSLLFQFFLTPLCLTVIKPRYAFSIIPIVICICFVGLGISSALETLIIAQAFRRAIIYALGKPIESLLFAIRSDEEAYKGRNVIDTFVYRLGDSSGASILGFLFGGIVTSGAMFSGAFICVFLAGITYSLGREHEQATAISRGK